MKGTKDNQVVDPTAEMGDILARAHAGDRTAIPALRQFFEERPELWEKTGDLAVHAELALLDLACPTSLLAREAIQRKLVELRSELAGENPTPLERLLVARIALSWLHVHLADIDLTQALSAGLSSVAISLAQKRLGTSQRNYLAAIKQLALVRKLLVPPISPVDLASRPLPETTSTGSKSGSRGVPLRRGSLITN